MAKAIKTMGLLVTLMAFAMTSVSDSVTAAENPCKADIEKLCGDVKPGEGRIQACLKEHKDEISQECKDKIAEAAEKIQEKLEVVVEACQGDAEKLCPGIEPGEGRILKCLIENKEELSDGCKTALKQ